MNCATPSTVQLNEATLCATARLHNLITLDWLTEKRSEVSDRTFERWTQTVTMYYTSCWSTRQVQCVETLQWVKVARYSYRIIYIPLPNVDSEMFTLQTPKAAYRKCVWDIYLSAFVGKGTFSLTLVFAGLAIQCEWNYVNDSCQTSNQSCIVKSCRQRK